MTRILLVSNDYPPRPGGIQSYLEQLVTRMAGEHELTVYAPRWKGSAEYDERVAERLSFTRAAEELSLSQPTVSAQIRALTDEVGMPLLEKVGRRLRLTPATARRSPRADGHGRIARG